MRFPPVFETFPQRFGWLELLVFTILTALSVYTGQVSIFYIVYLFWWNELINILIDYIFSLTQKKKMPGNVITSLGGLFQMFIYFIFIVVLFAFIANWHNEKLLIVNMRVLFFKNIYFNLNLLYIAAMRIVMLVNKQVQPQSSTIFTPNMIVLHISIIVGALLMFFVVKTYPDTFTPDNLWGSVIIILPFLLLRLFAQIVQRRNT